MPAAARVTDLHACPATPAGPVSGPGATNVLICGMPAARIGDVVACTSPETISSGEDTVLIGGKPAARMWDMTAKGGGCPHASGGVITTGCPTVLIGKVYEGVVLRKAAESGAPFCDPFEVGQTISLDQVVRDYQVQDDKITNWSPKGLGIIPIPFTGEYRMTETEAKLLDKLSVTHGLLGLYTFNNIKEQAFDVSEKQFSQPNNIPAYVPNDRQREWINNDGQRDAFRHAYWNALLTKEFGEEWTSQFTTAHEALPNNPITREAMDLYNNEIGRQIALSNPNANEKELGNLVAEAINNGELVVVDQNGKLAWSNQVTLWEHGLSDNTSGVGGQPVPNGNASAQ